jgi:hypothetical protein
MYNLSSQQPRPIQVICYSGHSYADKPKSFISNGEQYDIDSIEREWLEPREKHFIVKTIRAGHSKSEKRCHICYDTREDTWQLKEIQ